ncbi:MAG: DUF349 domain-containing protein [Marinobacter sp.]|nr:DUF349 domain-containing protein [Marinobacter sp.]
MAAFIQKLFKSRKSAKPAPKQADNPAQAPVEDTRANQRDKQLEALGGQATQDELADLAINGVTADIRLSAAQKLTDPEALQRVQKQAKGRDKGVYQIAKQALQALKEARDLEADTARKIQKLINSAEEQANSEDTKLFEARLDALLGQWQPVESSATAEQTQQFLEAVHRCRQRLQDIESELAESLRHEEQQRQRKETLTLLEDTLEGLKSRTTDLPSLSSLDALQRTQENRWLEATRDTDVGKQEQKAYETHMQSLRHYLGAVRRLSQAEDAISQLSGLFNSGEPTSQEHRDHGKALLKDIDWPEEFPLPQALESVRKLAGKRPDTPPVQKDTQEQQALSDDLQNLIEKLESALEAKQFRESRQLLKSAQTQFKQLDRRHARPFQARMQLLAGQFRELSDWQGFATEPKQIALCEQMEYLANQPMEPEAKAERIKELQNEWRELGGSSDRTLWSRFKAASDKAFEPCKAYFEAKSGLKQANLEKRQAICDELETFLTHADWNNVDWKGAERIHQTARQEWKQAWPVEFRDNRQVQKRFDDLLRRLEKPLDEERRRNEALKQDIVEKAQSLVEHEPLQEAMNEAKALQAEWKAIGITRHREDRKLWQAFRKACDRIFERRDAQRNARHQATEMADQTASEVLANLDAQATPESDEAIQQALTQIQSIDTGALSDSLKDRVRAKRQNLTERLKAVRLTQKIGHWQQLIEARGNGGIVPSEIPDHWHRLVADQNAVPAQELVIRAEILGGIESPADEQQRRMEIQVKRLTAGLGNSDQQPDPLQEMEQLVAQWCLQPSEEPVDSSLAQRLNKALMGAASS